MSSNLRDKRMVRIASIILVAFAFMCVLLQAINVVPPGESPGKDRLKLAMFAISTVYCFICAVAVKTFPGRGKKPMPTWAGRGMYVLLGVYGLAISILQALRIYRQG
jgi:hypothetical protein